LTNVEECQNLKIGHVTMLSSISLVKKQFKQIDCVLYVKFSSEKYRKGNGTANTNVPNWSLYVCWWWYAENDTSKWQIWQKNKEINNSNNVTLYFTH